jgi:hypothetical protein
MLKYLEVISLNFYCYLQLSDVVRRYHDGAEITSSAHVTLSDSGESFKLELKDAQLSDSGTYKCKIVNRLGEKTHEAKLSLIGKFSVFWSCYLLFVAFLMPVRFSLLLLHLYTIALFHFYIQ